MDNAYASDLATFQTHFARCLRQQAYDIDIPQRAKNVYQQLIWNNFTGFINQCFPICKRITDKAVWQKLQLLFFQQGSLHTPYFSEINRQFVEFLQANAQLLDELALPPFFAQLAHYEWIELYVDNLPNQQAVAFVDELALNPTVQALHYDWAVHTIGAILPKHTEDTFVLVYRKQVGHTHQVAFMSVNALTYLLITFIAQGKAYDSRQAMFEAFAAEFGMPVEQLLTFAEELFSTMLNNQVFVVPAKLY